MRLPAVVRRTVDHGTQGLERLQFVAPLATRIVIGLAFVQTGLGKWAHLDRTAEFFAGVGIPFPGANAAFVATLEVIGGSALVAGLLTRLFAAGLASTMIVALLTADRRAFLVSWTRASDTSPTDVTSFVFLLFLLWLVLLGPGAVSLDRLPRLSSADTSRRDGAKRLETAKPQADGVAAGPRPRPTAGASRGEGMTL